MGSLVPKLCLGMPMSWQLCCPSCETEFRKQVRSQTEFGNEESGYNVAEALKMSVHSVRNASMGLTKLARRAGIRQASNATTARVTDVAARSAGLFAETS
jgi:hypothetical protein